MRELFRTDEGHIAWKSPATEAEARRLLGALVQPQPERHLRLVLGADGEILVESLVRRGWVAWREKEAPAPSPPEPPAQPKGASPPAANAVPASTPSAVPAVSWPPAKPAPEVSSQDIDDSLDAFFRKMTGA